MNPELIAYLKGLLLGSSLTASIIAIILVLSGHS